MKTSQDIAPQVLKGIRLRGCGGYGVSNRVRPCATAAGAGHAGADPRRRREEEGKVRSSLTSTDILPVAETEKKKEDPEKNREDREKREGRLRQNNSGIPCASERTAPRGVQAQSARNFQQHPRRDRVEILGTPTLSSSERDGILRLRS